MTATDTGSGMGATVPTATGSTPPASPPPALRFDFGRVVGGLILLALGLVWLLDVLDVVQLRAALVLPVLLAAVGVSLMVGSLQGSHPTLVTVGVLLAVATVFSALSPPEALRGGIGERRYVVDDVADLETRYRVGLGDLTLDLSALRLEDHRRVSLSLGAGDASVIVPAGTDVTVDATVGAGEIVLFDQTANGVSVHRTFHHDGGSDGGGSLELIIEVGAGQIEVRR